MVEQYFTVTEVADLLRKHPQTVRGDIKAGNLTVERLGGRNSLRISETELKRYIEWLKDA